MKLLIASDLHGSATCARTLFDHACAQAADRVVLLGDLLYHGPRNSLPEGYDPKQTSELLNAHASRIVAVRGNCDAEVDQMVLDFPCQADSSIICDGAFTLFLTHGHVFNPDDALTPSSSAHVGSKPFPTLPEHTAFLSGHTHIKVLEQRANMVFVNPGSISLPKDDSRSFATYEDGTFTLRRLEDASPIATLTMRV